MRTLIILGIVLGLSSGSVAQATLKARLKVTKIALGKSDHLCTQFQGTRQNSTLWVSPEASGGSGKYDFVLTWRLGSAYRDYGIETQFEQKVRPGKIFGLNLPTLRDDVPYAQQTILLTVRDADTGEVGTAELMFTVSREVILTPSRDPALLDRNCFERFNASESMVGVLTNGSTNVSNLVIKQGVDRLWSNTLGSTWGFYISPFSMIPGIGTSLAGLFMANRSYYSTTSKQTSESIEVSSEYQLSPGDSIQIYTQKTRYITFYDATLVDACGARTRMSGAYPLQWWGFAYHAVPINPYDPTRPNINTVGARPVNTCPSELTPGSGDPSYSFFQTNL
jgi:hypothetical protein